MIGGPEGWGGGPFVQIDSSAGPRARRAGARRAGARRAGGRKEGRSGRPAARLTRQQQQQLWNSVHPLPPGRRRAALLQWALWGSRRILHSFKFYRDSIMINFGPSNLRLG